LRQTTKKRRNEDYEENGRDWLKAILRVLRFFVV
jgi:hypothetical protein